jgi:catechol 2,3-dioxygenase-like lactoylglutathione lyase family enzyme
MKLNTLIPELTVLNIDVSLNFYTKILGFKIEYFREEDKFAFISLNGAQMMLEEYNDDLWNTGSLEYPFGRGINFSIEVPDINPILENLKNNNINLKLDVEEKWYRKDTKLLGEKHFLVMDPDGYLLRFLESLGEK